MKSGNSVKFWSFISDNVVALATVAAGLDVLVWQAFASPMGHGPQDRSQVTL
jgi:hypothetical protein